MSFDVKGVKDAAQKGGAEKGQDGAGFKKALQEVLQKLLAEAKGEGGKSQKSEGGGGGGETPSLEELLAMLKEAQEAKGAEGHQHDQQQSAA